jgi:hypothetical protein
VDANLKDSNLQLEKIVGENPDLINKLRHLKVPLEGITVFEIQYSKKH